MELGILRHSKAAPVKEKAHLPFEESTEGRLVVEDIQVMVMRGGEWEGTRKLNKMVRGNWYIYT